MFRIMREAGFSLGSLPLLFRSIIAPLCSGAKPVNLELLETAAPAPLLSMRSVPPLRTMAGLTVKCHWAPSSKSSFRSSVTVRVLAKVYLPLGILMDLSLATAALNASLQVFEGFLNRVISTSAARESAAADNMKSKNFFMINFPVQKLELLSSGIDGSGVHHPCIRCYLAFGKRLDMPGRIKYIGFAVVAHVQRTVAADSHGTVGH